MNVGFLIFEILCFFFPCQLVLTLFSTILLPKKNLSSDVFPILICLSFFILFTNLPAISAFSCSTVMDYLCHLSLLFWGQTKINSHRVRTMQSRLPGFDRTISEFPGWLLIYLKKNFFGGFSELGKNAG